MAVFAGCGGASHSATSATGQAQLYSAHVLDAVRIHGAEVVVLERRRPEPPDRAVIERVTILPGMGFSILQITAYLPGRGEVELLKAPDVAEAARIYRDAPADRNRTTNFGAGVFAPYG